MGANHISFTLPGTLSRQEVQAAFDEKHRESLITDGCSYSGEWGCVNSLRFPAHEPFPTVNAANEYAWRSLDKREAIAVKAQSSNKVSFNVPKGSFTISGILEPLVTQPLSTVISGASKEECLACEELKAAFPDNAGALQEAGNEFLRSRRASQQATYAIQDLCREIANPEARDPVIEEILAARASLKAADTSLRNAEEAFKTAHDTCLQKLRAHLDTPPVVWVVAGVSPS